MHGVQQRLPYLRGEPIAFAHRGAKSVLPDNTLEAFSLALRLGANGLETDAWLTSDGKVVLDHDGVMRRFGRQRSFAHVARDQLPGHIPTLDELFDTCGVNFDLSIDVKDDSAFETIVGIARDHNFDLHRLWLCHHILETTVAMKEKYDEVRFVDSCRLSRIKEGVERRVATLSQHGVDALNMHITDWNGGFVTLAHKFDVFAFGWDLQFDYVLERGLRLGLDAIYSDHVDVMVDVYMDEIGHAPRS